MAANESSRVNHDRDIDKARLGQVYAKALVDSAESAGRVDRMVAELDQLVDQWIAPFPQLEMTLASPRLTVDEKLGILERLFHRRLSEPLLRFLKVVCRHDRLDCLRQIRRAAQQLVDQRQQRVQVQVTTATPLGGELQSRIVQALRAKLGREVRLQAGVRPELIGGLVVRIGDTVFDSSVAGQLQRLRHQAVESTMQEFRHNGSLATLESDD